MSNAEEQMDAVLRILEDQRPHSVSEIASLVNISAEKVESLFHLKKKKRRGRPN